MDKEPQHPRQIRTVTPLFMCLWGLYLLALFVIVGVLFGNSLGPFMLPLIIVVGFLPPPIVRQGYIAICQGYSPWPHTSIHATLTVASDLEVVSRQVVGVLQEMGVVSKGLAEVRDAESRYFEARTPMSGTSSGQNVQVSLARVVGGGTGVRVLSRPLQRTNVFDGGCNQANVAKVLEAVRRAEQSPRA